MQRQQNTHLWVSIGCCPADLTDTLPVLMLQLGRMSGPDFHHLCLDQWALLALLCLYDVLQRRRLRAVVDKRTYYRNAVHVLMENKLESSAVLIINRGGKC